MGMTGIELSQADKENAQSTSGAHISCLSDTRKAKYIYREQSIYTVININYQGQIYKPLCSGEKKARKHWYPWL